MKPITFFDIEVDPKSQKILDIGSVKSDDSIFHSNSIKDFENFLSGSEFICGHNVINHDLKYLSKVSSAFNNGRYKVVDTLYLSPLLFPTKPYHRLLKDDKIQTDELNNPLNDSEKAKDLFYDEVSAFENLNVVFKQIFFLLLHDKEEFKSFFVYVSFSCAGNAEKKILESFQSQICSNAGLDNIIQNHPIELAYSLAVLNSPDRYSITPRWVLMNYPEVARIMFILRNNPCMEGCVYCNRAFDANSALKKYFGFDSFRKYNEEQLQEKAINAALQNKSLLAIFPTGGGKSITFQVPALIAGENIKGLTVVISPLQSLMKDQVDNLEKSGITESVTINGMLDPIERANSYERVEDGSASILYISPESLRSKTIEWLLLGRKIARFVIDEAHCFSAWGQDFRVDYLYIADFIQMLQEKKNLSFPIPVSCFTATAKQKVIEDIRNYFQKSLSLTLEVFKADAVRTNLQYKIIPCKDKDEKYCQLRLLLESKDCPKIVYVSKTRKAYDLAKRLSEDGFRAKPYHGKMDVKEKTENQNAFINDEIEIIVATSAFGMGVDKKDVGMVIHYEISNSLENYVQEAGRAGRDETISADCFVLYNEDDLNSHFILLNQTRINRKEIGDIWRSIKKITRFRESLSNSALEIARKAGWDDNVAEIETRVKTAIAALENAGYIKRGQNVPRIFASSIISKNALEAIDKINLSPKFNVNQRIQAIRIIKKLISAKNIKQNNDETPEARVDYISDHLGIVKEEVIRIITILREEGILADTKDLTAFITPEDSEKSSLSIVLLFSKLENFLLAELKEQETFIHLKELNEKCIEKEFYGAEPNNLKSILNYWAIKNWIKRSNLDSSKYHFSTILLQPKEELREKQQKRHELAKFIVEYLYHVLPNQNEKSSGEKLIHFSVHELKERYEKQLTLHKLIITVEDIEDTLFYLSRIEALKIDGGFLVVYNKLTIDRLEKNSKIQYKNEDYEQLQLHYNNKVQQIHIVGEYATKMLNDYSKALVFVNDYFNLNFSSFLIKYFPGRTTEINRNITPSKFKELFGELSPRQLIIINDVKNQNIVVAAGPGSGKTKVLVHKLASLLLMEEIKHEQLLMLTFSRAAATEFKKRLLDLIGNAAGFVEIKTFHSYCFDLLGRVGSLEKSDKILQLTVEKILNGEVEQNRITKSVVVIDEAQDMNINEFALIKTLMDRNEEMKLIAVGDDDQNIYTFRGSDSKYFEQFIKVRSAAKYELIENYRSQKNLVCFTNQYVEKIFNRFKKTSIVPDRKENGKIKIIEYKSENLIVPLVKEILSTELKKTTCILTTTNDEALIITGLLLNHGMPAKLIQTNEGFNLYNLYEMRAFLSYLNFSGAYPTIRQEDWDNAIREFKNKHRQSFNYDLCVSLIKNFQEIHARVKYKSDFEAFIRESKMENFLFVNDETINVSTIHKAKGKEFDNVFLLLDNFNENSDDKKREIYVAMTRAKENLFIHTNRNYFRNIKVEELHYIYDTNTYSPPEKLTLHLNYNDVYLDYFKFVQQRLYSLISGQKLLIGEQGLLNLKNELIIKFSKQFVERKEGLEKNGFKVTKAKVNFILYWKPQDVDEKDIEIKIVLPELLFEKITS